MKSLVNLIEEAYINEGAYFDRKIKEGREDPTEVKNRIINRYRNYILNASSQSLTNAVNKIKEISPLLIGGGLGTAAGMLAGDVAEDYLPEDLQDHFLTDPTVIGGLIGGIGGHYIYNNNFADDINRKIEKLPEWYINRKVKKAREKYSGFVNPRTGKYVNLP